MDDSSTEQVVDRFLEEDPFVQVSYHTPSYVRLSYQHIVANVQDYEIIKDAAGGEQAKPQEILATTMLLQVAIVNELCQTSGVNPEQLRLPNFESYINSLDAEKRIGDVLDQWRKDVTRLNRPLLEVVTATEIEKMAKSKAVVNSVGETLHASTWRSNMIGGSPCDWEWSRNHLPQAGEQRTFNRETFLEELIEEGDSIDSAIYSLCYLLGTDQASAERLFAGTYVSSFAQARQRCLVDNSGSLDQQYRDGVLKNAPHPRISQTGRIIFE